MDKGLGVRPRSQSVGDMFGAASFVGAVCSSTDF